MDTDTVNGTPVPNNPPAAPQDLRDLVCQHCPVRAERAATVVAELDAERELGVAGAAR